MKPLILSLIGLQAAKAFLTAFLNLRTRISRVMSAFFINAKERSTESGKKFRNGETKKWRN
jgi:hypothetical protein